MMQKRFLRQRLQTLKFGQVQKKFGSLRQHELGKTEERILGIFENGNQSLFVNPSLLGSRRNLNVFSVFSKEAWAREREKLQDEVNRGYFEDFKELKKTSGKMATTARALTPVAAAALFPHLLTRTAEGSVVELPPQHVGPTALTESTGVDSGSNRICLVCVTFRAGAQAMVESWSKPFVSEFGPTLGLHAYEVSFIESWLLSLPPVRTLLLRTMRSKATAGPSEGEEAKVKVKVLYAFGDTWTMRKALGIINRLTGYAFLLDERGRVRWRASGMSTEDEVNAMIACTKQLLKQAASKSTEPAPSQTY